MNDSRVVRARLLIDGARKLLTEVRDEQPGHTLTGRQLTRALAASGMALEHVQEIERNNP